MAERQGKQDPTTDRTPDRATDRTTQSTEIEEEVDASGSGGAGPIPELVRRAIAAGFSGFFFTEEAIRKAIGDTLPRDWSDFLSDQSERARAEFFERLSYEIARSMENVDYAGVLAQLLEGRTLEVSARIRLLDEGGRGRRPRLRVDVSRERES